jgi:hypothetical protein
VDGSVNSADDAESDIRHQVEQQDSYLVSRHTREEKRVELIVAQAEPSAM